jgi:MinD superfamily P-loop ATPase
MQEITILSGKGGTGKTSISAALASVAEKAVFCDDDVDAADLHLIFQPKIIEEHRFESGWLVSIDPGKCTGCNMCKEACRFDAIQTDNAGGIEINPFACEGCRLCERVCPEEAISSTPHNDNFWYVSDTRFGTLVHARMGPGQENSGKLVTQVRKKAKEIAEENKLQFIVNDGPPGIGCPVISSVTGTQKVLMVVEPSKSGLHDAKRLHELVKSFDIPQYAIINKSDINLEIEKELEDFLLSAGIPLLCKISFDTDFVKAMIESKNIVEFAPDSEIVSKLKKAWKILSG